MAPSSRLKKPHLIDNLWDSLGSSAQGFSPVSPWASLAVGGQMHPTVTHSSHPPSRATPHIAVNFRTEGQELGLGLWLSDRSTLGGARPIRTEGSSGGVCQEVCVASSTHVPSLECAWRGSHAL